MEPFDPSMTLSRPYLIRAMYDWIIDNDLTPYVLVDCSEYGLNIPSEYIENNQVVLNIGLSACADINLGNDELSFYARFSGVEHKVEVKVVAILAIFAKENNQGMFFNKIEPPVKEKTEKLGKPKKAKLTIVKK